MDKLQFHFKVLQTTDGKSNVICLIQIATPDGHIYKLPSDYYSAACHVALIKTSAYAKVKKSLKERHQSRKVWIHLTKELRAAYLDEDDNLQFEDEYLEEATNETDKTNAADTSEQSLSQMLEKLLEKKESTNEERNTGKLAKEFTIEKFDGKNPNADQWLTSFEKECERFKLTTDVKKIEILKSFMGKSASDWYTCTLLKLTINSEWENWKMNFCQTFASRGWNPIKYAITFKYQSGSLLEYSMKKEKLLLQIRDSIDEGTLIDLIATGLPNYVLDKIDREKIKESKDLHNKIGKLEHLVRKSNFDINKNKTSVKGKNEKVPCTLCMNKGKGTRFHPEADCWFKNQDIKSNKEKQVNNLVLDVELSEEDPKN